MKRILAIALFTIATLSASTGSLAQDRALRANIPFNFTVGETQMPAGEYIITSPSSGLVRVQSQDRRAIATVSTSQGGHESKAGSKLVFNHYGNQYFLHRVLCPLTYRLNVDVPVWKAEKKARMNEAKLDRDDQILVEMK